MSLGESIAGFFSSATTGGISTIVSAITNPISAWQDRKREVSEAKHAQELARYTFETSRILSTDSHNAQWELESLNVKKRSPMQWLTLVVLGAPFVIAWFNPELVSVYFTTSILSIPEWYVQLFVSIVGVIWGVAQIKNVATGIRTSLMEGRKVKHEQALELAMKIKDKE